MESKQHLQTARKTSGALNQKHVFVVFIIVLLIFSDFGRFPFMVMFLTLLDITDIACCNRIRNLHIPVLHECSL